MEQNNNQKSLFVKCQCFSHLLEVECIESEGFNLTFWRYIRQDVILNWHERLRWMWRIFRTGNPWTDGIMISNEQAKTIVDYINKHLPKE